MTGNQIKAVIFDWGGVLIEEPTATIISYCSKVLNVPPKRFESVFRYGKTDFQSAIMTEEQYWTAICDRLQVPAPVQKSLWGEALRFAYRPKPEMFELVRRLRNSGVRVALLSNTEMPAVDIYHERHEGCFDVVVLSCLERLRKPAPEIYRLTLERLDVHPEEAIFIDDKAENIEGAKVVGLNTMLFTSPEEVIAWVQERV